MNSRLPVRLLLIEDLPHHRSGRRALGALHGRRERGADGGKGHAPPYDGFVIDLRAEVLSRAAVLAGMVTALKDCTARTPGPVAEVSDRTSGIYVKAGAATTPEVGLAELREITGDEPAAVLFFASVGRPPASAAYPLRPSRLDQGYSLTHRLTSWLHSFTRSSAVDVPMYLSAWFPCDRVVVIPLSTPDWDAGALVVTRACALRAAEIRSLAADLALRLEQEDRRARIHALSR